MAASVERLNALVRVDRGELSAEQLGLLQREIGIATWVWDVTEDAARWYGDPSALLGFPPGTFTGRFEQCLEHIHPEDRGRAYETMIACLKGLQPEYRTEGRVVWPNGSVHWLACYGRGFYGPDGRALRLAGVIREISDSERTERLLRVAREKFEVIFAAIPDAVAITREPDSTVVEVNDAWVAFTGHPRQAILGRTVASLGLYEVPEHRDHIVQSLARGQPVINHQTRYVRADGRTIDVRLSVVQVEIGGEAFVVWSWSDISEQKREEQMLMRLAQGVSADVGETFFQSLVGHVGRALLADYVMIGELLPTNQTRVRSLAFWNQGAAAPNFEYKLEGTPCADAMSRPGTLMLPHRVTAIFPNDVELRDLQVEGYVGTSLFDSRGNVIGILVAMSRQPIAHPSLWASVLEIFAARAAAEIERSRAEAQVRELNVSLERRVTERTRELEAANRELDAFSYSVSHDLRAPLHAIAGFAEIVRVAHGASLSGKAMHYFERIEHNAKQMDNLIGELLEFSRAWRTPLNDANVDMRELTQEVLNDLRGEDSSRAQIELGDLPPARGDRVLLRQVWTNLIGNALKFSRGAAPPRIRIRGDQNGREVEYSVADNGAGFDPRYADKLFGVFQRLHSSSEFEGSGVGLALVQRIVTRHGGRVSAEGAPGKGATFRFVLPSPPGDA